MIIRVALRIAQPSGRPRPARPGGTTAPEIEEPAGPAPGRDRRQRERRARRAPPDAGLADPAEAAPLPAPARAAAAARGFAAGNGYLTGLIVDRLS